MAAVDSKVALESLLAGYKYWRNFGNNLLIGGLIVEVFISLMSERRKYKPAIEVIAGLAVLVGVCVEVAYGGYADDVERQIRQGLNLQVATLDKEAGQLRSDAASREQKVMGSEWLLGNIFLPRRVAVSLGPSPTGNGVAPSGKEFAKVAQFAGTKAIILAAPDAESCQLAVDIMGVLIDAKWVIVPPSIKILPLNEAYRLVGVHLVLADTRQGAPLDEAAATLWTYLESGYLSDFNSASTAGIRSDVVRFASSEKYRPVWWSSGFAPPSDTLAILVGSKDFESELSDRDFLEQLQPNQRQWFLEHHAPWRQ